MSTSLIAVIGLCLWSPLVVQAQEDPLTGIFLGDGLRMVIVSTGPDTYAGQFELGGDQASFTAESVQGTGLRGTSILNGVSTSFEAVLRGDALLISDGVQSAQLRRTADVPPPLREEILAGAQLAIQDVPPPPQSSATVQAPYLGFNFTPPAGWSATEETDGYILRSSTFPGQIILIPHDLGSIAEVRSIAREGYRDESLWLQIEGDTEAFGERGLSAMFTGSASGTSVRARGIGLLSDFGGGLTLMIVGSGSTLGERAESDLVALAESVEFFQPRARDAVAEWRDLLWNARLTYLYSYYSGSADGSYVGAEEEVIIDICGRGFFNYGSKSSFSADGGGGTSGSQRSNGGGSGSWEVVGQGNVARLSLSFYDGSTREYDLARDEEGNTLLSGQRYFRTYANSPLAEARPACPG